jgi:archaemetzincin
MTAARHQITIQPLGDIPCEPLRRIRAGLATAFSTPVSVSGKRTLPRSAWDPQRRQFDATQLLLSLQSYLPSGSGKVLGVCDVDLGTQILTFVFGEAEVDGRFAVISLHRLREEVYGLPANPSLFLERCAKEAIHEIGHTVGLRHCFRYDCVMRPSDSIEATDLKRMRFCASCTEKLHALYSR